MFKILSGRELPQRRGFLTTEEVLEYLQVNLRTVYRLIKAGKIPAVRVGRQWRFRKRTSTPGWTPSAPRRPSRPWPSARTARDGRSRCSWSTTNQAFASCSAKRSPSPNTTSIRRRTAAALERLRDGDYDLLIADLKMPGMDGLTLIREAKRLKADLPVIIITGFSTESSAIERSISASPDI